MVNTKKVTKTTKGSDAAKSRKSAAKSKKKTDECIYTLPSIADLTHVKELHSEWLKALKSSPKQISINCGEVGRITTPVIQLMLSLALTADKKKIKFSVLQPSEAFEEAMHELGLKSELATWSEGT